ncbi:glycosyltransferase involved in cell wall biosynthesis [Bacteroides reticulotermitis]|uniref:Glycosyltransferase involved in cell wall biosynthesis n=1 Tax=Bacteroides reticulotermitis TaxID=1133319 RepID=A0A840D9X2_9BACE|nr:glycogen/starch synthase [Bacteroides reticulotermitis]MBB4045415.1 glycosyltransferase involved in cell wall biosynthesis [Bacteroides reticulotermitis]
MVKDLLTPDYIFEASWEVCNKVGGIYTVLSTRANTLQSKFRDRIFFIGPDVWQGKENPLFVESDKLCAEWKKHALEKDNLSVRVGRWNIPGEPIVLLVDFQMFFKQKNEIYAAMWNQFQVDSLHAYGDYDEASMFSYAAGKVVESFYRYNLTEMDKVVYQAHEWMTGMGALYVQDAVPEIGTIFTTHATSIGRSIAGNNKPLYDYLFAYNGDQMAQELNMQSKHSIEKQTAHYIDCFTTVSQITNNECRELLKRPADVVLMNGFEDDFVPKGSTFTGKRKRARSLMLNVANKMLGTNLGDDTLIVGTSGRYEFKNKGIDTFLESLNRLNKDEKLQKNVLAFISVPAWVSEPREDLKERLKSKKKFDTALDTPFITHWLHNMEFDQVLNMLKHTELKNSVEDKVKVIFVPCYLDGNDGIWNKEYYDLLLGQDLSVYASYYEPWGYTPLESVAFRVPTITTDLAGFGLWVNSLKNQHGIIDGVEVLHRSDYNYSEVSDGIKNTVILFSTKTEDEVEEMREHASKVAEQALWKHFIQYYYEAYDIALRNAKKRQLA